MIKVYLANKIFIKLSQLEKPQRDYLISKYRHNYSDYCAFTKKYVTKTLTLFEIVTWTSGERWVALPPNLNYFKEVAEEINLDSTFIDRRVNPIIDFPKVLINPRGEQIEWLKQLEKFEYDALLSLPTGSGKTALSIYIASLLKTPMLFIASKTSYLESFKKEVFSFVENAKDNFMELKSEFFKQDKPEVKAFQCCSIQTLSRNLEHLEKLKDSFGFVVLDEIHSSIFSNEYRKAVYSLNSRNRIYLSATPEIRSLDILHCMVSKNIVNSDISIDFDINFLPMKIVLDNDIKSKALRSDNFMEKKGIVASDEKLFYATVELIKFLVKQDRGILVYSTVFDLQQRISEELNGRGIKTVTFNSETKKSSYEGYLKDFDIGDIKCIIGGTAVVEALSLYRLSVIIDLDLSLSINATNQLLGRLKRKNDQICAKDKVFVKYIYQGISENKYKNVTLPVIKSLDYVKIHPTKTVQNYSILEAL